MNFWLRWLQAGNIFLKHGRCLLLSHQKMGKLPLIPSMDNFYLCFVCCSPLPSSKGAARTTSACRVLTTAGHCWRLLETALNSFITVHSRWVQLIWKGIISDGDAVVMGSGQQYCPVPTLRTAAWLSGASGAGILGSLWPFSPCWICLSTLFSFPHSSI